MSVVVGRCVRTANPVVSVLALPPLLDADHRDHRHDGRGAGYVQADQGVHLGVGGWRGGGMEGSL